MQSNLSPNPLQFTKCDPYFINTIQFQPTNAMQTQTTTQSKKNEFQNFNNNKIRQNKFNKHITTNRKKK